MAYPHKWSPISYKSSAGQRKHIGQRPMLYRWTTQPTRLIVRMLRDMLRRTVPLRPYSIPQIWIEMHCESGFGFTGKSNGLDSPVLSEVTSLLFVYVCDTDVTSGFASESTSKLDSPDSRIRIRIRIRQIEYGPYIQQQPEMPGHCRGDG